MSVVIRPADATDVDDIAHFLARHQSRTAAEYRVRLTDSWMAKAPNLGFLIEAEAGVVGFHGVIYAQRMIDGKAHCICHLIDWAVEEAYRSDSLALLKAVLAQPDMSFVSLSASPTAAKILKFFRFIEMDDGKHLVPTAGMARSWLPGGGPRIVTRPDALRADLSDEENQIMDDHVGNGCRVMLATRDGRRCFVVFVRRRSRWFFYADILHASDSALLREWLPFLARRISLGSGLPFIGIDKRILPDPPAWSFEVRKPTFLLSRELEPPQLDALYSEFVPRGRLSR